MILLFCTFLVIWVDMGTHNRVEFEIIFLEDQHKIDKITVKDPHEV